jgi:TetR/AcrR family transcriptional regulator, tetracycline repressor protein
VGARGPQPSLSRERIVAAAVDLLDAGAPVTVRAVAAGLDVRPNTIYTYFPDKVALEGAVADRLLALADPDLLLGRRSWRNRVVDYAVSLRTVLLARPTGCALFHTAPMNGPVALTVGERLLALLTGAGLPEEDASRGAYTVITYVLGATTLANADGVEPARRTRLESVDAAGFPLTARTAHVAVEWNGEDQFRWGLTRLLDALAPPR